MIAPKEAPEEGRERVVKSKFKEVSEEAAATINGFSPTEGP